MWATEKIATSNIKYSLKDKHKRKIINQAINAGVSVLATQEVRSLDKVLPETWAVQEKNNVRTSKENKISWDTTIWEFVWGEYVQASFSDVIPAASRWISIVLLRHRETGIEVYFVNFHSVAHVDRGGRPGWTGKGRLQYLRNRGKPNPLVEVYDDGMDAVVKVLKRLKRTGKHVVFMGDVNVDAKADERVRHPVFVYRRLAPRRFKSIFMVHGYPNHFRKRFIDQIWVLYRKNAENRNKVAKIRNFWILPKATRRQDHKTVVAKVSWQG